MKMTGKSGAAIAAAAATMLFAGAGLLPSAKAATAVGQCIGANTCKGQSACKSGNSSCKGQNACKGQGFAMLSKSACAKAGGEFKKS